MKRCFGKCSSGVCGNISVSYTHLDVYKRQDTDRDTVVFSGILCCFKKNIQPAGWFSIAAIYKLVISGEVKGIHSGFDFFCGRIFFVPERLGITDAVLVASDTEGRCV